MGAWISDGKNATQSNTFTVHVLMAACAVGLLFRSSNQVAFFSLELLRR